jgi:hypothetical protein
VPYATVLSKAESATRHTMTFGICPGAACLPGALAQREVPARPRTRKATHDNQVIGTPPAFKFEYDGGPAIRKIKNQTRPGVYGIRSGDFFPPGVTLRHSSTLLVW